MANQNIGVGSRQKQIQKSWLSPQMIITAELLQKPILELEISLKKELRCNPFLQDIKEESEEFDLSKEIEENSPELQSDENEDYDLTEEIQEINKILNDLDEIQNTKFEFEPNNKSIPESYKFEYYEKERESLWDIFNRQIKELHLNKNEQEFADILLNSIDKNGYLHTDLEDLAENFSLTISRAEEIHSMIMGIYPRGIGARNLAECLIAQLDDNETNNGIVIEIIKNDLDLLQNLKYNKLSKKYNMSLDEILIIKEIISHLDPKPGRSISSKTLSYIIPDIIVKEIDGKLEIIINDKNIPELAVNQEYARRLIAKSHNKVSTIKYIKSKLLSAENYVKAVWIRRETLHKITNEIIRSQPSFFNEGKKSLSPMTYDDVARHVNRDISTISRVVKDKYIDTPFGVYPLRWFFTKKVGDTSSQIIKKEISKIIDNENKSKPLSDKKIKDLLAKKEIDISLRVVTKYRNQLGISVSRLRKKIGSISEI
ncbi:MAG: RNA polymerase factor sigma-54 [Candidatus Cloacimonetes bacterium]|nr:RNA polymerase factor sigma-54 [Candidatus Cloacimonadota bacterium]MBL7085477.1 RNA polymerase factor sigma-54 [Candidatus Cloacimonadota bacterium]